MSAAAGERLRTRASRAALQAGKRFSIRLGPGYSLVYRRGKRDGQGAWFVRIRRDGQPESMVRIGSADDAGADGDPGLITYEEACIKARAVADRPSARSTALPTVGDAVNNYLAGFSRSRSSYATARSAASLHILPQFGSTALSALDMADIRLWHRRIAMRQPAKKGAPKGNLAKFRQPGLDPRADRAREATANRILGVLKAILNRAVEDGLAERPWVWHQAPGFKPGPIAPPRHMAKREVQRLVEACEPDFRKLVRAAMLTGCRYGDLCRLSVADVSLADASVYIRRAGSRRGGHKVFLSRDGVAMFRAMIQGRPGHEHVFLRSDGSTWGKSHQFRHLRAACAKAGISPPICFRDLRYNYGERLARSGESLETISQLLGRADNRITLQQYQHLTEKTLRDAVARLDEQD